MATKPAYTIAEQIELLKSRGMQFQDVHIAADVLKNINYYRLKGYWWDMQSDYSTHQFKNDIWFEDVFDRYTFDRKLRLILFDAIERIEIALRTKMIYHFSHAYGAQWYSDPGLFLDPIKHARHLADLKKEFDRSQEIFVKDHLNRFPGIDPDAWKILEVASLGTLSKIYKNLDSQLPEKAIVGKELGLNLHSELASWLEAIVYIRNIIAHHSRLWSRNMVKTPKYQLKNPSGHWFSKPLNPVQLKKPFLIISCMVYLCDKIAPQHHIREDILSLFSANSGIPIYKLGFLNNWDSEPLWR